MYKLQIKSRVRNNPISVCIIVLTANVWQMVFAGSNSKAGASVFVSTKRAFIQNSN